jgi:hypothetical protein
MFDEYIYSTQSVIWLMAGALHSISVTEHWNYRSLSRECLHSKFHDHCNRSATVPERKTVKKVTIRH